MIVIPEGILREYCSTLIGEVNSRYAWKVIHG